MVLLNFGSRVESRHAGMPDGRHAGGQSIEGYPRQSCEWGREERKQNLSLGLGGICGCWDSRARAPGALKDAAVSAWDVGFNGFPFGSPREGRAPGVARDEEVASKPGFPEAFRQVAHVWLNGRAMRWKMRGNANTNARRNAFANGDIRRPGMQL